MRIAHLSRYLVALFLAGLAGCDPSLLERADHTPGREPSQTTTVTTRRDDLTHAIRIASFNLQVFGVDKLRDDLAIDVLADIVRRFDVVAVQEIRAVDQTVLDQFVQRINAAGYDYQYLLGPRLGRTRSKEQYAFLFDAGRIEVESNSAYTLDDPQDVLHREPMVARFQVRTVSQQDAFTFTLVNIHTDPDERDEELDVLDDVLLAVRADGSGEDDVILLGDVNAGDGRFGQLGRLPDIDWAISGQTTNTAGTRAYDNIFFDRYATVEFTGDAGVFDFQREFGLSRAEARRVSDHLPVWAEFTIHEGQPGARLATRPQNTESN